MLSREVFYAGSVPALILLAEKHGVSKESLQLPADWSIPAVTSVSVPKESVAGNITARRLERMKEKQERKHGRHSEPQDTSFWGELTMKMEIGLPATDLISIEERLAKAAAKKAEMVGKTLREQLAASAFAAETARADRLKAGWAKAEKARVVKPVVSAAEEEVDSEWAATVVQAAVRGKQLRDSLGEALEDAAWAATVMQAAERGRQSRISLRVAGVVDTKVVVQKGSSLIAANFAERGADEVDVALDHAEIDNSDGPALSGEEGPPMDFNLAAFAQRLSSTGRAVDSAVGNGVGRPLTPRASGGGRPSAMGDDSALGMGRSPTLPERYSVPHSLFPVSEDDEDAPDVLVRTTSIMVL
jgi:hypothetical protein